MKNKELLDSFSWIKNTGVTPSCEYVEVITSWSQIFRGKSVNFHWLIDLPSYIIKYREISKEELLPGRHQ